jgi:hypothetical protein
MSSPMLHRWLFLFVCIASVSCGEDTPSRLTVDPDRAAATRSLSGNADVDRILTESLFLLPVTATAELQTRALVSYIGGEEFTHEAHASADLGALLEEKIVSPYTAVMLAYHAAGALAWDRRVLVLDCVPGTAWYLEVDTEDGRFLLDPYHRSVATLSGPLDPALPYADVFTGGAWSQAVGRWPVTSFEDFLASWQTPVDPLLFEEQYRNACLRAFYEDRKTVAFPIGIAMAGHTRRQVGVADGRPGDVDAFFADAENETRSDHAFLGSFESPIGPVTFSHVLRLQGLIPGRRYRYVLQQLDRSHGHWVVLPKGVSVEDWLSEGSGRWVLPFIADASSATLEVSVGGGSLAIDWFAVEALDAEGKPLP